jgi:hypothetical protein
MEDLNDTLLLIELLVREKGFLRYYHETHYTPSVGNQRLINRFVKENNEDINSVYIINEEDLNRLNRLFSYEKIDKILIKLSLENAIKDVYNEIRVTRNIKVRQNLILSNLLRIDDIMHCILKHKITDSEKIKVSERFHPKIKAINEEYKVIFQKKIKINVVHFINESFKEILEKGEIFEERYISLLRDENFDDIIERNFYINVLFRLKEFSLKFFYNPFFEDLTGENKLIYKNHQMRDFYNLVNKEGLRLKELMYDNIDKYEFIINYLKGDITLNGKKGIKQIEELSYNSFIWLKNDNRYSKKIHSVFLLCQFKGWIEGWRNLSNKERISIIKNTFNIDLCQKDFSVGSCDKILNEIKKVKQYGIEDSKLNYLHFILDVIQQN